MMTINDTGDNYYDVDGGIGGGGSGGHGDGGVHDCDDDDYYDDDDLDTDNGDGGNNEVGKRGARCLLLVVVLTTITTMKNDDAAQASCRSGRTRRENGNKTWRRRTPETSLEPSPTPPSSIPTATRTVCSTSFVCHIHSAFSITCPEGRPGDF